jgi:hypothetical protein
VYQSAIALVREARAHGVKTAVVSSSRNTAAILHVARVADLFQVRVTRAGPFECRRCTAWRPSIRVAINGKTYELAASEHCAVELT